MNNERAEVEIRYMSRIGTKQYYFEVWVRSVNRPDVKQGTIIERDRDERKNLGIAAAAIAEGLCEQYGDHRDPMTAEQAAIGAYDRLILHNPIPAIGGEEKLS